MTASSSGTVLFGDVVDSRRDPGSSAWLRDLRADLDAAYPRGQRLAAFGFTQGDEIQGLLALSADPFLAVLRAGLRPDARGLRWSIVAGEIEPGSGPSTERTGPAFHAARDLLVRAKTQRLGLLAVSGDPDADALLEDLAPMLATLLAGLTPRQREIGRLILIDDLRRAEAADRLSVSRATVSVIADRGRLRHLAGLVRALATIFHDGVERARGDSQPAHGGTARAGTGSAA